MEFDTLLLDLDGTLYSNDIGLWDEIHRNINRYLLDFLNIPADQVSKTREFLFTTYGTTFRGIQKSYPDVDPEEYLAFVHNVPLEKYISLQPEMRSMLQDLSMKKWIFTNADEKHARRVLDVLGITDLFEGIIDVWATDFVPKPDPFTYETALMVSAPASPETCVYVDDQLRNLVPAAALGMTTVLVGSPTTINRITYTIPSILNLADVLTQR
ncbi:MAG: pyrimidine 5'-nucleotidase [Anaerolineales bacterium]|nr:pyrimidine 5'-nucleotidase [Anaerolineales bacterium]